MLPETLAGQPTENDELVFDAPWQARSFAMAVKLNEAGLYSWKEWSERLSDNIAAFESSAKISSSDDYYSLWQLTLEEFVAERSDN